MDNRDAARVYALAGLGGIIAAGLVRDHPPAWLLAIFSLGASCATGLLRSREERLGPDALQLGFGEVCFFLSFISGFTSFGALAWEEWFRHVAS